MKIEDIKKLTGEQAMLLYREYSDDMWAAGWIGGDDIAPFDGFVKWLLTYGDTPAGKAKADYEKEFVKSWDEWRIEKKALSEEDFREMKDPYVTKPEYPKRDPRAELDAALEDATPAGPCPDDD